uniref:Uncharacterized protein n=1 Tax=Psilocybe cubensis TaxID=181762 RepID=A0A8H8CIB1_PSICU
MASEHGKQTPQKNVQPNHGALQSHLKNVPFWNIYDVESRHIVNRVVGTGQNTRSDGMIGPLPPSKTGLKRSLSEISGIEVTGTSSGEVEDMAKQAAGGSTAPAAKRSLRDIKQGLLLKRVKVEPQDVKIKLEAIEPSPSLSTSISTSSTAAGQGGVSKDNEPSIHPDSATPGPVTAKMMSSSKKDHPRAPNVKAKKPTPVSTIEGAPAASIKATPAATIESAPASAIKLAPASAIEAPTPITSRGRKPIPPSSTKPTPQLNNPTPIPLSRTTPNDPASLTKPSTVPDDPALSSREKSAPDATAPNSGEKSGNASVLELAGIPCLPLTGSMLVIPRCPRRSFISYDLQWPQNREDWLHEVRGENMSELHVDWEISEAKFSKMYPDLAKMEYNYATSELQGIEENMLRRFHISDHSDYCVTVESLRSGRYGQLLLEADMYQELAKIKKGLGSAKEHIKELLASASE